MKQCLFKTLRVVTVFAITFFALQLSAQKVNLESSWGKQGTTVLNQSKSGVTLNFSVEDFLMSETNVNKEVMTTITMRGVQLQNDEGAPNVPGYSRYIAIPQGAVATAKVVRKNVEVMKNMDIAPAPHIPLDTDKGPLSFKKNNEIYSVDALYPSSITQVSKPMKIRGMDVVLIAVNPFQYNPVTKELVINKDIEIEVTFEGGNGQFGDSRLSSRFWDPIIHDAVINEASIPKKEIEMISKSRETGAEYLIIVPDDPIFLQWADSIRIFRLKQGITTKVVTTTEIGGNTTTAIEDYIDNAYNTWDTPPAAALLIGDYGTTGSTITSPIWDDYCISDNYYADVDGDMMPDVVLARMTAQNETHLETMVTKFINYERNPPTNPDFYSNPITAMGWQTERWFQLCSEVIAGFFENSLGKTPVRENALYQGSPSGSWSSAQNTATVVAYFGDAGLGYIPDSPNYLTDWGGNATRINEDINDGAFLLQHRDHGGETGWGEPSYSSSDIDGLVNEDLPFIFSINCLTGKFNISGECFAEKFHRYTYDGHNSGALGIIAATEVSYSFVNDTYTWGLYDNLWPEFMPDYGSTPEHRGVRPAFGNAAGKYFLRQSSWPYNTSNKEVTYYLFHNHGDAFLSLYTEVPQNLTVVHDDILLSGLDNFSITVNDGATICLTVGEEIIGLAEGTGSSLDIPIIPQEPGTMVDIVITMQDYYRYETTIEVIPPNGPYCMYASHTMSDELGNGNNNIEFDEEILFSLTMKNLGTEDGIDIITVLESDPYAEFIDNTEDYDTILIGEFVTRENGYKVHISDGVPDQHEFEFSVIASDENDSTWTSRFFAVANAPEINPGNAIIDDSQQGNNNGRLDPGETADMKFLVSNTGHCAISDVVCTLTPFNQYITVNSGAQTIATLGMLGGSWITYSVTVADDAPNSIIAEMLLNASAAGYSVDNTYYPKIGIFLEDWETGDFSKYDWVQGGNLDWEIINLYPYEGFYHARSGNIGDNQTTSFEITYDVLAYDSVKFYKKISSEANFDKLNFYIDNTIVGSWSGALSWSHEKFPVSPGNHTLKWEYAKDYAGSIGSDCAWIDYIELPTMLCTSLFAGPDDETCTGSDYNCLGSATNFSSLLWLTSGDGTFDFPNAIEPTYTPGSQDSINGDVTLTLTIVDVDGDPYEDSMLLTFISGADTPNKPVGPDYVDVFKVTESQYATDKVEGAIEYLWTIDPEEAGTIIAIDTFAVVQWNTDYLGDANLTVAAANNCGFGTPSEVLVIAVDNTVGIGQTASENNGITVSPNPNNGTFTLSLSGNSDSPASISLVNYVGMKVLNINNVTPESGNNFSIEVNDLPSGVYILSVEQDNNITSRKVLIHN